MSRNECVANRAQFPTGRRQPLQRRGSVGAKDLQSELARCDADEAAARELLAGGLLERAPHGGGLGRVRIQHEAYDLKRRVLAKHHECVSEQSLAVLSATPNSPGSITSRFRMKTAVNGAEEGAGAETGPVTPGQLALARY
jgi:hypothetical protein